MFRFFRVIAVLAMPAAICLNAIADDSTPPPKELVAARESYKQELSASAKPIRESYIANLQSLLKAATQRGDLKLALAYQNEINGVGTTPPPKELVAARERYQQELDASAKPGRDRYIANLQSMLRAATQRGDLKTALAYQNEIDAVSGSNSSSAGPLSAILGKWAAHYPDGHVGATWEFYAGGKVVYGGTDQGTWTVEGDKITFKRNKGDTVDTIFLPLNPRGTKGKNYKGIPFTFKRVSQ